MPEGKDSKGYLWIQDRRYDDYFYLADFEHLVVCKVNQSHERLPPDHWEAIIYDDSQCHKILGREAFKTEGEAKSFLEENLEKILKNKKSY